MSNRTKKFVVSLLVMSLLLVGIVGAAQAQTPDPANPAADPPNRLQQMQERLGPDAWGQMVQRMTERHGAEATGQMLRRMATNEDCSGTGHGGMMGHSDGTTGHAGGMMNGFQRGMGRMMGSWH
ncbi:MAG: hypothetical protein KF753_09460 [Caldilineaceae bacterium]|nr:hypothetical protein [Caldilineaceae bacterium]